LADLWAANLTSDLSACGHSTLPSLAACRCRAWEQQSPLAPLFRRYEEELQRAEADRQRLQAESAQLAGLLAAADVARLSGGLPALRSFQHAMHSWLAVAQAFSSATSGKDRGINTRKPLTYAPTGAALQLPEEAAAICREHQRKLQQAQAQVSWQLQLQSHPGVGVLTLDSCWKSAVRHCRPGTQMPCCFCPCRSAS
jgi:hypothetical protein